MAKFQSFTLPDQHRRVLTDDVATTHYRETDTAFGAFPGLAFPAVNSCRS